MKKLFNKWFYYFRIVFFVIHFFFLYDIVSTLWQIKPLIYLFLILHFLYCITVIGQIISKRKKYQTDFAYNLMQVGGYLYVWVLFYRIHYSHVSYMQETVKYFNINFGILSFVLLFLLLYSKLELKKR